MAKALITGFHRGLGFEFTRQLSGRGWKVIACCRSPENSPKLAELANGSDGQIALETLDIDNFEEAEALAVKLAGEPIDLLINNAVILHHESATFSEGKREHFQALGGIDYDGWATVFRVNVIGTMSATEAFLPNVRTSERKTIVMISSVMGSITANDPDLFPPGGGIYVYRSSKAALNMVARNLAADLKKEGITVLPLNPGWVKTSMGGGDGC